jgi:hypothetical protein
MTDRLKSLTALYLVILGCALAVVSMKEDDYRSRASRLDLKVMTLELKGQSAVIDRMGVLRNQSRAKAEQFEAAMLLLTIGLIIGSLGALFAAPLAFIPLFVSGIAGAGAGYFVWLAV